MISSGNLHHKHPLVCDAQLGHSREPLFPWQKDSLLQITQVRDCRPTPNTVPYTLSHSCQQTAFVSLKNGESTTDLCKSATADQHPIDYSHDWRTWPTPIRVQHTPSIAFRHLPPNSARYSYATEGALALYLRRGQRPPKGLGTDKTVETTSRPSRHVNMRRIHPR